MIKNKPIIVIGAGGHAKVLIDALLAQQSEVLGIVDEDVDKFGSKVLGIEVLGDDSYIKNYTVHDICLVNGLGSVGSMNLRKKIYEKFKQDGYCFKNVIHPSAIISKNVILAEGVQIMAGVVVNAGTSIGNNGIINTRASVDHDCFIGDHVHIAPGSVLSGAVSVGDCTHLGTGCTVIQGKTIGDHVLVGAGSLIIKNVKSGMKVLGVPAKEVCV